MGERFRIHADRRDLPPLLDHAWLLQPWWGALSRPNDLDADRWADLIAHGADALELVAEIDQAEALVLPFEWQSLVDLDKAHPEVSQPDRDNARQAALATTAAIAEQARARQIPAVAFFVTDDTGPVPELAAFTVFRPSLMRSTRRANEFGLPGLRTDFTARYCDGEPPVRPWRAEPTIGFCGYELLGEAKLRLAGARKTLARRPGAAALASRLIGRPLVADRGSLLRLQAIAALRRAPGVTTNFLIRADFWNGAVSRHATNMDLAEQSRREYVQNLIESDYALCVRGQGNYSMRLDEALSLGRLPVIVDDDAVLAGHNDIDWGEFAVIVPASDIASIGTAVRRFHASHQSDFAQVQAVARTVWKERLSPLGVASSLRTSLGPPAAATPQSPGS